MMDPVLFELAQLSVIGICKCSVTADDYERKPASKYMRWPRPLILDLEVSKWEELLQECGDGHEIEEFFLAADFTNQWLRTVVAHETFPGDSRLDIPSITFQSNVLPYDPCWSESRPITHKKWNALEFPFYWLKEGLQEKKTLKAKLQETLAEEMRGSLLEKRKRTPLKNFFSKFGQKEPEIGRKRCKTCENPRFPMAVWRKVEAAEVNTEQPKLALFGDIQAADVEFKRHLVSEGQCGPVSLVTWKKGKFIQKQFPKGYELAFENELEVVKSLRQCPHIVFSFGTLSNNQGHRSFFMEYMSQDLSLLIIDRTRRQTGPPFSPHDSVDILSQVAKALRYMHQARVNVVHCDLKSANILVSKIQVSSDVEQYVAKVTDFGSARSGNNGGADFCPGSGTTPYTAPEALQYFTNRALGIDLPSINYPHKIDVYSFGVVAFEVITGELAPLWREDQGSEFKKEVMKGTLKPPLRETCKSDERYMRDERLMKLIESCWLLKPSERPSFEQICEELDKAREELDKARLRNSSSCWRG